MSKNATTKGVKRGAENDVKDDSKKVKISEDGKDMLKQKPITFVTGNAKKLEEVVAIMGPSFKDKVDLPEIQGTVNDIIIEKCKVAAKELKGPCIVEDTSLPFKALKGLPGPYIKWFLDSIGNEGLHKMLEGFKDHEKQYDAEAVCTIAYHNGEEDSKIEIFEGIVPGKIVAPRGDNKFGWDPIFKPDGFDQTFAEMDSETKNKVSHRKRAVEKLRDFLKEN